MLCSGVAGLIGWTCAAPAIWAEVLAAAAVLALGAALALRAWHRDGPGGRGTGAGALYAVALLALAIAAGRPERPAPRADIPGALLVVVLDGSASLWREPDAARGAVEVLARLMADAGDPAGWSGRVIRFGRAAEPVGGTVPLSRLPAQIAAAVPLTPAAHSDGAAGLAAALQAIRAAGGRGAVALLSDGRFGSPVPQRLLDEAAAMGVAVHVLPAGSAAPGQGLVAADIGPEQTVGHPAPVRLTVLGGGILSVAGDADPARADLPAGPHLQPARAEARFPARGLRHVAVRLETAGQVQDRVLYTLVRGPARLLVFGAAPWADSLPPDRWQVERRSPAQPGDLSGFDAIAIDGLVPADFPAAFDQVLAASVATAGLLLVNGPMRGAPDQPQRIGDWNLSALGPLLPVDSDPRVVRADPPPRDVVIMIDVSGSMTGGPIVTARAAARAIIGQLTPRDSLSIVPFASAVPRLFGPVAMDEGGRAAARGFVDATAAGGGTDLGPALRAAQRVATNRCAFFVLSDGEFPDPGFSPRCQVTGLNTAGGPMPPITGGWLETRALPPGRSVVDVALRYFEPEERDEFFRTGRFVPLPDRGAGVFATAAPLDGVAIAFPRTGAEVVLVHPVHPRDPVLAFQPRAEGGGAVSAVFLTEGPAAWAGSAAILAILDRLTGWTEDTRHDIRLTVADGRIAAVVTALLGAPATLSARIVAAGGASHGLGLVPEGPPGRFAGGAAVPLGEAPAPAVLILDEPGQPSQRIPMTLPARPAPAPGGSEAFDFGIDRAGLLALAGATGGRDLTALPLPPLSSAPGADPPASPRHHGLIALALCVFCAAFWLGGHRI